MSVIHGGTIYRNREEYLQARLAEEKARVAKLERESTTAWSTKPDTECVTDGCNRPAVICTQHMVALEDRIAELVLDRARVSAAKSVLMQAMATLARLDDNWADWARLPSRDELNKRIAELEEALREIASSQPYPEHADIARKALEGET